MLSKFYGLNLMDLTSCFFTEKIENFNNMTIFVEIFITISIMFFMYNSFMNKMLYQNFKHWTMLELIWTIFPMMILIILGFPSLKMLYITEMYSFSSSLSLKVIGHQWYWEYSYPEFMYSMNSYPLLISSTHSMGESDCLVLPFNCKIRALITSHDVLHSWAIPSLGFKMDACPGRLNFFMFMSVNPSMHIGQCSELCGSFHSWMPIMLEFTSMSLFIEWMKCYL